MQGSNESCGVKWGVVWGMGINKFISVVSKETYVSDNGLNRSKCYLV